MLGPTVLYNVTVQVSDGITDTQALAVTVQNANDTGVVRIAVTQPQVRRRLLLRRLRRRRSCSHALPAYQWRQLVGSTWTNIAGATSATLNNQSQYRARCCIRQFVLELKR
jgi:hypothetical protein